MDNLLRSAAEDRDGKQSRLAEQANTVARDRGSYGGCRAGSGAAR